MICPVAMARGTISSNPLPRASSKLHLLDFSLGFTTVSYCIWVNPQKWVITTTCDVVYPIVNALEFKWNDIIGKLGNVTK